MSKQTDQLLSRIAAKVQWANYDVTLEAVDHAKSLAPVRTGYLRDHIDGDDVTSDPLLPTAEMVSEAHYSGYVNNGTEKMEAQPFMTPAKYELQRTIVADIAKRLRGT